MDERQRRLGAILRRAPVIPVLTLDDADLAVPLARALVAGGLTVLEVALRTPASESAVAAMAAEVPEAIVGAGTVLTPAQMARVDALGLDFAVSPGASPALLGAAGDARTPMLPGAATPGEVMTLLEAGFVHQKLFPASTVGGTALLDALHGPLPRVRFCPTGGIGEADVAAYLERPNVLCVGGSWVTPRDALAARDFERVTALARRARAMARAR